MPPRNTVIGRALLSSTAGSATTDEVLIQRRSAIHKTLEIQSVILRGVGLITR